MWKQLGSLRERVREHAKSAAQVAQGVLQAAAAEDEDETLHSGDYSYSEQQAENEADWGSWDQTGFQEDSHPPPPPQPSEPPQPPQLGPPPLPPPEEPPVSPPESSAAVSKPKAGRRSRYVVTGINSSSSKPHAPIPAPLVPTSFITPVTPGAKQGEEENPIDYVESEPPRSNGENEVFSQPVASENVDVAETGPVQEADRSITKSPELEQQSPAVESDAFLHTETLPPPPAIPDKHEVSFDDLVPNSEGVPTDSANKNEHEESETVVQPDVVQSTNSQEPEPEPFIDWGDEDWTVEGDAQMGVQNASEEVFADGANELGADLDWFSAQPSKTPEKSEEFAVGFSEPLPAQEIVTVTQDDMKTKEETTANNEESHEESDQPGASEERILEVSKEFADEQDKPAHPFQDTIPGELENADEAFFTNLGSAKEDKPALPRQGTICGEPENADEAFFTNLGSAEEDKPAPLPQDTIPGEPENADEAFFSNLGNTEENKPAPLRQDTIPGEPKNTDEAFFSNLDSAEDEKAVSPPPQGTIPGESENGDGAFFSNLGIAEEDNHAAPPFQGTILGEPENADEAFFSNLGSAQAATDMAAQEFVSEQMAGVHRNSSKENHYDDMWVSTTSQYQAPSTSKEQVPENQEQLETIPRQEKRSFKSPSLQELGSTRIHESAKEIEPLTVPTADENILLRTEIEALKDQVRQLNEEKDGLLATKKDEEGQYEEQRKSVHILQDELKRNHEIIKELSIEKESLLKDMQRALRDRHDAEAERDAAIERGGDGIKEAHHLIEVMKNNEEAARERETVITEQIEALRSDMERISTERNSISAEADDLRHRLDLLSSQTESREEELKKQLQIAIHEREIATLEREKALESIKLHAEEYENLYADERNRLATLQEKDFKIEELERLVIANEKEKEDENMRIDILSKQIEEMKDRTRDVIEERNNLYHSKASLEKEVEQGHIREDQINRELSDSQRANVSLKGERDEARGRYTSMREQNSDLTKRFEALAAERDRLVKERTAVARSSDSVSEKEKSLATECEQKTKSIALFQRKLTSYANKIEKLTLQRGTFQRQRDEAGARLRAAGAEFATLHARLDSTTNERDELKTEVLSIRDERDNAKLKIEELSEAAAKMPLLEENLQSKSNELNGALKKLEEAREEISDLRKNEGALKQRSVSLSNESSQLRGKVEVLEKEKSALTSQNQISEQEKGELRERVNLVEEQLVECNKKESSLKVDLATLKEKSSVDIGLVKAELLAEQKSRQETSGKLALLQRDLQSYQEAVTDVHSIIRKSLIRSSEAWESASESLRNTLLWPDVSEDREVDASMTQTIQWVSAHADLLSSLVHQYLSAYQEYELNKEQLRDINEKLTFQEDEIASFKQLKERCVNLEHELNSTNSCLQTVSTEKDSIQQQFQELNDVLNTSKIRESELENELRTAYQSMNNLETASSERDSIQQQFHELNDVLTASKIRESELENELRTTHHNMTQELDRVIQSSKGDMDLIRQELEKVTSSLGTIWGMIQKCLSSEHFESFTDDGRGSDAGSNISVQVLRGTASLVAELSRTRSHLEDSEQRRSHAESEVLRLTDRAEIAEQERDAVRGSNERLERKAKSARSEGHEEAKNHFEGVITQMEDELEEQRHNLERMKDKASRSEKDSGELRALCNKLTSQLNTRTNELDEIEEKNVYLQDQVTNLTEDLEEAHRRLQEHEEESAIAQKEEVERLGAELEDITSQLEKSEELCSTLRAACDEAQSTAKESELLAETHRRSEENLRIAIEQLEAAQDSLIEQRTVELQQKLNETNTKLQEANDRVAGIGITENKLQIQEEEIKELRGAIGRLADERVELKLELENSLSRLNQPDAGGQLVDRRVVRQLLVSYFRVGSVRRRDVLELMSRMLAFSETDNIAVGLKRRALIDRLGSLVQPPELDNATLPPIGTVSDKWIEFLMKETEEGEEQAKGW